MNQLLVFGLIVGWAAILVGCWLGWQLLRQNGRLLLRLEAIEKHLDESGGGNKAAGLPLGSPAPDFELPDLAGVRKRSAELLGLGQPQLLIFFNPGCGFCRE